MALYSAAVVSPSGLEICAAVCLWVSVVVLVRDLEGRLADWS
jgi:hypothetical protein